MILDVIVQIYHQKYDFSFCSKIFTNENLKFDSNFECGNLASSIRVNEYEYDLFIRPDDSD